ncbi:glycosyltransferase family 2 protein [Desulfovibrio gilichinskyi]|uniref:Glycosyltransferase involved in cell wall bisynthesis n=1 Tax=Desulfovibrio gilichinskyi TaxID=1519643 RepID=A0A1X7EHP1_9BACT|nr:glycosyltransferase family 2 protein [Desulfovibrio gilichinskyi]SMF34140.1 Glycosyltransferase involved in cell wall bisynthesis [Desulfovibrio gilichinskyi]
MKKKPILAIIIPCYNEEETLFFTSEKLLEILQKLIIQQQISSQSFLFFIDDGSKDKTWEIISSQSQKNPLVKGLKLSANAGHQNALLAGMFSTYAEVDCIISIDADLQDDIDIIPEMINEFQKGNEIVYGVRSDRKSDSLFKRKTAEWFYSFVQKLGLEIKPNHADFRLMSTKAVKALNEFEESNIFLRGICPKLGFQTSDVFYLRQKRVYGETKYPLAKMLSFAWNGISSFSIAPLRLSGLMGGLSLMVTLVLSISTFWEYLAGRTVPGWASIMIAILFLGSVQLLSIAILGEYIGKIFTEVKKRPRYIIEKKI